MATSTVHRAAPAPSQCDRVLAVLADGQPHSYREIHERAGFMRLNSRIAELRARGHNIECVKAGGDYRYRIVSALEEIGTLDAAAAVGPPPPVAAASSVVDTPSDDAQLSLLGAIA